MDIYESRAHQLEELQKQRLADTKDPNKFWVSYENRVTLQILRLRKASKTYNTNASSSSKAS